MGQSTTAMTGLGKAFLAVLSGSRGELRHEKGVEVCAMARNISVELLSGKVCTLAVRPDMTIGDLKEEVKVGSRARGGEAPFVCCVYN